MSKFFKSFWSKSLTEIKSHPLIYFYLALVLILALFVRVYRTEDLLGFYYDQGRDAKVIWRFWHEGRPFLTGPVTGLQGIFLGPLYYYLIAPFYLIGGGNPVLPTVFLGLLSTSAVFLLYYLGWKLESRTTGLIAATIGAISFELVKAGRWLANPTPIFLTSMLLLWVMWRIVNKKRMAPGPKSLWLGEWIYIALLIGISLQFEAASAVYYLPMILVFAIWQRNKLPNRKIFLTSSLVFLTTLLPQVVFNFRHENILFNNFKRVLIEEQSFRLSFWKVLGTRIDFFWSVFYSKIFPNWPVYTAIFVVIVAGVLITEKKSRQLKVAIKLLLIFLVVPMIGYMAFQGNFGNIYDYYMSGYYFPMILLFSLGLGVLWKSKTGRVVVVAFLVLFILRNTFLVHRHLTQNVDELDYITLTNELRAVNWVFEDASVRERFNVDVYVPPVIPHAYDYLFLWQGTARLAQGKQGCEKELCGMILDEQVSLLYTLYEADPSHPWRLESWLARQKGIGEIVDEVKFDGITVQRRERI